MPVLSEPNLYQIHIQMMLDTIKSLISSSTVIIISEELQRYGEQLLQGDSVKEKTESLKNIVDYSYREMENSFSKNLNNAMQLNSLCMQFLDFIYKGHINGKKTVITTVSDLIETYEKIKSTSNIFKDGDTNGNT